MFAAAPCRAVGAVNPPAVPMDTGLPAERMGQPEGFAFPVLLQLLQPPGISPVWDTAGGTSQP